MAVFYSREKTRQHLTPLGTAVGLVSGYRLTDYRQPLPLAPHRRHIFFVSCTIYVSYTIVYYSMRILCWSTYKSTANTGVFCTEPVFVYCCSLQDENTLLEYVRTKAQRKQECCVLSLQPGGHLLGPVRTGKRKSGTKIGITNTLFARVLIGQLVNTPGQILKRVWTL